jgi:hypothetical protein
MTRSLALALAALILLTDPARAAVRSLFVGIDAYAHSHDHDPSAQAGFQDLKGAVADVALMRSTLKRVYGLAVGDDPDAAGPCPGLNTVSITLLNACATRQAILAALEAQIAAADPGDIVLFYFAGHGSEIDSGSEDRVGHRDSTIVPSDAHRPPTSDHEDVLDAELKSRIALAAGRGVSVVTIFDSCHAGTATREFAGVQVARRAAPALKGRPQTPVPPKPLAARADASGAAPYQVHLAAAGDTEEAHETVVNGTHHGLFTWALAQTLPQMKGATYFDIAAETRRRMEELGQDARLKLDISRQHSQGEGALPARFLGAPPSATREYPARTTAAPLELEIAGGGLSGVTAGSSFGVFASASQTDRRLALGLVSRADFDRAVLRLAQPLPAGSGPALWVREIAHRYGADRLTVRIVGGGAEERGRLSQALAPLTGPEGYVSLVQEAGSPAQFLISLTGPEASFATADGRTRVSAGPTSDPAFAGRIAAALKAAANYFALLGLRNDHGAQWGEIDFKRGDCPDASACDLPRRGDRSVAQAAEPVDIWIANRAKQDLYRYTLFLNAEDYEITVLSPPGYSNDPPLKPGDDLRVFQGRFTRPGRGTLLLLLTEAPINVATLRQDPVRDIDSAARNDLEKLLLLASAGQRGSDVPSVGDWGALAASIDVEP